MQHFQKWIRNLSFLLFIKSCHFLEAQDLPQKILEIMHQSRYQHANWGLMVKDQRTQKKLYEKNSHLLFLPGSTTKLFSVAALLEAYGEDYRFKTPVFALGTFRDKSFEGDLILVARGDLTMGGRLQSSDQIAFTSSDHIYANQLPQVSLTKQDPLFAFRSLAKQILDKGIQHIKGRVLIDDRLFETIEKRGFQLSPIMVNENLIDFTIYASTENQLASLDWRPKVKGYTVQNDVKTVAAGQPLDLQLISNDHGKTILVQGTIPIDQQEIIRTFTIENPREFAQAAFVQALEEQGITVEIEENNANSSLPNQKLFQNIHPIVEWISPPLSEYAKLILKVSHNIGADLIPLLLAAQKKQTTFDEGMLLLGQFVKDKVQLSADQFVFIDGAGGDENRLTPQAEIQLLDYMQRQSPEKFKKFYQALPILGKDGSLANFGKQTAALGKVYAKTGTGVSFNLATQQFFLTTQALAGYIEGKNGQLIEFMVVVNNATMPQIQDIFPIFEDLAQIANVIYESSDQPKE